MGNIGTKEARKVNKLQYTKSTTMTFNTSRKTHMLGPILGVRNGIQREIPVLNGQDKKLDKFFSNNRLEKNTASTLPIVLSAVYMRLVP
eukprot:2815691-Amphidinium_carterae.1